MSEPIKLEPHLTTDQLYKRYRGCRHPQEKLRWRALYLISNGELASQAARRVGRSSAWMTKLARRYNQQGPASVPNQRNESIGRKPLLDKTAALDLDKALHGAAPDGGLWTAPKVIGWIKDRTGAAVDKRPPGDGCVGSALHCNCLARSIAKRLALTNKRHSKKVGSNSIRAEAGTRG